MKVISPCQQPRKGTNGYTVSLKSFYNIDIQCDICLILLLVCWSSIYLLIPEILSTIPISHGFAKDANPDVPQESQGFSYATSLCRILGLMWCSQVWMPRSFSNGLFNICQHKRGDIGILNMSHLPNGFCFINFHCYVCLRSVPTSQTLCFFGLPDSRASWANSHGRDHPKFI